MARIGKQYFLSREGKMQVTSNRTLQALEKPISITRKDIKDWVNAQNQANALEPKNHALQLILKEIAKDALLSSQVQNRKLQIHSIPVVLKDANGEKNEEQTLIFQKLGSTRKMTNAMLDSIYFEYSLVELELKETPFGKDVNVITIPRTNVVPKRGLFYPDYTQQTSIEYRKLKEYGTWILEFLSEDNEALLNKCVPHVLFKKFASSCWSELCEIYGIPPRVLKTDTQDPTMLKRGEAMMKDIGAAAWFIIDSTEDIQWGNGMQSDGAIFNNLIAYCNSEISMAISGAIIGQDTQNGSYNKDESAQNMLWELVKADMDLVTDFWNNIALPAYANLGLLKEGLTFEFESAEDPNQLMDFVKNLLPYKKIDNEWLEQKFGIKILGDNDGGAFGGGLKTDSFFD